jgi:hypothetical protein
MKLKLPSWATITLGVFAGILAILNQTTFDIATPWKSYVTIALVFLSALGISPLVGEKFQSAVHLAPSVGIVISAALAALAVGLSTLGVSEGVKGLIQGVIVFFSAFGFAPAAQYMLGSIKPGAKVEAFTGAYPHETKVGGEIIHEAGAKALAVQGTHRKYKGGRLPAFWPPALKEFTAYCSKLVAPPAVVKAKILGPLPIDGNATYGDCTIAGFAHLIQIWNWLYGHLVKVPSEAAIDAEYFKLTGGADAGLVEAIVLATAKKVGLFGERIGLYAPIKTSNREAIKQAVAFYGGAYLGIMCPESAQRQFGEGKPWTYEGETTQDGHCVVAIGYNAQGLECATWGGVALLTWGFLDHYLDEVWAVLSRQLIEAGEDTLGVKVTLLEADIARA